MTLAGRNDLVDWLRLHLAFLYQPQVAQELLDRLAGPREIFALAEEPPGGREGNPSAGGGPGEPFPPPVLRLLRDLRPLASARQEVLRSERGGITILRRGGPDWPAALEGLPSMPLVLFLQGQVLPQDSLAVGIVGSRRPTPYGLRQAARFAGRLASLGITVVSGLARGIDAAAHEAALDAGGRTIAVLGSGLGRIYPREHQDLARRIAGSGAVLGEFPWDAPPRQFHFPHRNRILSGLSLAVVIVEAGERSGSLVTAGWAAEQGREVLVLPGRADGPEARGSLRLIQEGAQLVLDPEEVAAALGVPVPAGGVGPEGAGGRGGAGNQGPTERPRVPPHLAPLFSEEDSWDADRIIQRLGRPPGQVLAELSRLEAAGVLRRFPDGAYGRR